MPYTSVLTKVGCKKKNNNTGSILRFCKLKRNLCKPSLD